MTMLKDDPAEFVVGWPGADMAILKLSGAVAVLVAGGLVPIAEIAIKKPSVALAELVTTDDTSDEDEAVAAEDREGAAVEELAEMAALEEAEAIDSDALVEADMLDNSEEEADDAGEVNEVMELVMVLSSVDDSEAVAEAGTLEVPLGEADTRLYTMP